MKAESVQEWRDALANADKFGVHMRETFAEMLSAKMAEQRRFVRQSVDDFGKTLPPGYMVAVGPLVTVGSTSNPEFKMTISLRAQAPGDFVIEPGWSLYAPRDS